MKLRRIGVLKGAYFMGIFGVAVGLIVSIIAFILVFMLGSIFGDIAGSFVSFSFLNFFLFPILYGIGGFIGGFIFIPLANLVLKLIKGIDLEFGEEEAKPDEKKQEDQKKPVQAIEKPVEAKKSALPKIQED